MAKEKWTVREAGRKGGKVNAATHDHAHFVDMGRKGGEATAAKHGSWHFQRIGRLGGARVKELVAKGRLLEYETDYLDPQVQESEL